MNFNEIHEDIHKRTHFFSKAPESVDAYHIFRAAGIIVRAIEEHSRLNLEAIESQTIHIITQRKD